MHSHPQNCPQCDYIYVTRHAYESHSWWQGFRFWRQLQPDALTPGSLHYSKDMLGLVPGKGQCSQEESRPSVIMCTCMLSFFSHVQLFVIHTLHPPHPTPPHPTPTTMDCSLQAPLFMEFSRQEYCSKLPFTPPGDLSHPGIEPRSPALQADYHLSHRGSICGNFHQHPEEI